MEQLLVGQLRPEVERRWVHYIQVRSFKCRHKQSPDIPVRCQRHLTLTDYKYPAITVWQIGKEIQALIIIKVSDGYNALYWHNCKVNARPCSSGFIRVPNAGTVRTGTGRG